ncbi:ROK family protein [Oscillospiraceae bacterium PP1C4]
MSYRIGIDIGGTNLVVGLVDENFAIVDEISAPTPASRNPNDVVEALIKLLEKMPCKDVSTIGIGSPGVVDKPTGTMICDNTIDWNNFALGKIIAQAVGIPTFVDNDANCAALGEYAADKTKGYSSMVFITIGTGVGSGVIINDKLLTGAHYCAPEFGHTTYIAKGEPCNCGRTGCYECYASFTALIRDANRLADKSPECQLAKLRSIAPLSGKQIFDCAHSGDETALELVAQFIDYIADGVVNLNNIFDPEVIVIGGGIAKQGDFVIKQVQAKLEKERFCKLQPMPLVKMAILGNDAGVIGAAMLPLYQ